MRAIACAAALLTLGAASPPSPFETLRLSAELARRGQAAGDPLLLLAAARMRRQVAVVGAPDRAAAWIDAAIRLGATDPRVASLAADIRSEAGKGRAAGPRVSQTRIGAGEQRRFTETFRAGIPAVVYVEGDGDSDLTLRVGGASGMACRDASAGDVKLCAWTPRTTEPMAVEIANVGAVENRFILGTN